MILQVRLLNTVKSIPKQTSSWCPMPALGACQFLTEMGKGLDDSK